MVTFIGDNSQYVICDSNLDFLTFLCINSATLSDSEMIDFIKHPNQNKSKKNKKLIESIKIANQILRELTTLQGKL